MEGSNTTEQCRKWYANDPVLEEYHDKEWCKINHSDTFQFEMLCLEGASVGLSWKTIIHRRDNYRKAFFDFDIEKCAAMTDDYLLSLMDNKGIIRSKSKISSVRSNARAVIAVQQQFGSFDNYLWSFTEGRQVDSRWDSLDKIPVKSQLSKTMSMDMKKRGFSFVGEVITYSFLQSVGIVNDHLEKCCYR